MVKIQRRLVKSDGHFQLILKVKGSTWLADVVANNFRNKNFKMAATYLKVKCKELENYFISNEDMINLQLLETNTYQVEIVKYKELS